MITGNQIRWHGSSRSLAPQPQATQFCHVQFEVVDHRFFHLSVCHARALSCDRSCSKGEISRRYSLQLRPAYIADWRVLSAIVGSPTDELRCALKACMK